MNKRSTLIVFLAAVNLPTNPLLVKASTATKVEITITSSEERFVEPTNVVQTPSRQTLLQTGEQPDWIATIAGAILLMGIVLFWYKRRNNR